MVKLGRICATALAVTTMSGVGLAQAGEVEAPITERHDKVETVVTTPVTDLNLMKTDIPPILQEAAHDPYSLQGAGSCEAIATTIAQLDAALGADKDTPAAAQGMGEQTSDMAVGVLKAGVQSLIPFRGVVRQISGANAYEKKIEEVIQTGFARRGFLKGRAVEMNCPPGASPANFTPSPVPVEPRPLAPRVADLDVPPVASDTPRASATEPSTGAAFSTAAAGPAG